MRLFLYNKLITSYIFVKRLSSAGTDVCSSHAIFRGLEFHAFLSLKIFLKSNIYEPLQVIY